MSLRKKLHHVPFFRTAHPRRFARLLFVGCSIGLAVLIGASAMPESHTLLTRAPVPSPTGVPPPWGWLGGKPCTTPRPSRVPSGQPRATVLPTRQITPAPTGAPLATPSPAPNGLPQLIEERIKILQHLLCAFFGTCGSPTPTGAPTHVPVTVLPSSQPPVTGAPSGQGTPPGGVAVDYAGVPLSVTAEWSGTNVNAVQAGTRVSLTNFTIAGSHPNQVVYLALVSKGATALGNIRCTRSGDKFVQLQKANFNGDIVYILYRGHGNLSVPPGNDPIECRWDKRANVHLGAAAFYNVDNSSAEFYSKATPADTASFPSVGASQSPGNLIFGWGGVGVAIPVAPANYISAYLVRGAQSVDLTSFIVGPGANEALFVGITSPGPLNATVTWDGQALSLVDTYPIPGGMVGCDGTGPGCPTQAQLYWYFLTAPHPGNKVLHVSWTNTTSYYGEPIVDIGAISFSGVHQTTPFSSITHSSGNDSGVADPVDSITIPTAPGDETVALWGSIYMEGCSWNQTPNWPLDGHGIGTMSSRAAGTSGSNTHSLHHGGPQCGIPSGGIWGMSGFNIKAQ